MSEQTQGKQMTETHKLPLFQRPIWVSIFALTAAVVWGWAYPLIKLGFEEYGISPDMTGSKMLFAGIRFMISGLIILGLAQAKSCSFKIRKQSDWIFIIVFSLLNTTLHYAFFYFGLSHSEGSRAAILNSLSVFALVILACIFFKSDKMTTRKIIGCIAGFAGILALNIGNENDGGSFTWLGDGMIIMNALCSALAGLMTRGVSKRIDIFVGTGYSLGIGGLLLMLAGFLTDGTLPHITLMGIVILCLLIGISTTGFALYNKLLSCNPVGKVAIYNSLIPVVGAVSSCMCLGEQFYWKYVVAGILATAGIYMAHLANAGTPLS